MIDTCTNGGKHLSSFLDVAAATSIGFLCFYLMSFPAYAQTDDEEAEIVMGCYYSNGEWGQALIDVCVKENQKYRAEVLAYPKEHAAVVTRCRKLSTFGWEKVKTCVDKDIEAAKALTAYPESAKETIDTCRFEKRGQGSVVVKACVDALQGGKGAPAKN